MKINTLLKSAAVQVQEMTDKLKIQIRIPSDHVKTSGNLIIDTNVPRIYTPGQVICESKGFLRGHGTYADDTLLKSSVAGVQEKVDNLVSIRPIKHRYNGEVGDVIVGRITEVQQKRWKVDTNARLDSVLPLSSVNLPGGETRRKSAEDEQAMRQYLQEGDLISAEVHMVYSDGSLALHTRNLKYGKLSQGILVKVSPYLVKRRKTHSHNLPCGATIILGNNGYIWICPITEQNDGGFTQDLEMRVPKSEREVIARLRNCIMALAQSNILLYDTSIMIAFEESQNYAVRELLSPEAINDIAMLTQQRLVLEVE